MVKAKIVLLTFWLFVCSLSYAGKPLKFTWEAHRMDGSRTGAAVLTADNALEAIGSFDEAYYYSPNGQKFPKGSATYEAALDLLKAQEVVAPLKKVVANCAVEMRRGYTNSPLGFWIVDRISEDVAKLTGRKVDFGIINIGGIREDMPAGPVMTSELMAMLPFVNYLSYVALKGSDLQYLIESTASKPQSMYGVKVEIKDGKVLDLLVGGKPIDANKIYGVATIDFLLDGGDKINVARNAKELIITDVKVIDSILPYAISYGEAGKEIEYSDEPRVIFK